MSRPALLFVFWLAAVAQADILHLRGGSRYYGEFVAEERGQVVFRVVLPDGTASAVRTFPREQVERVERTGRRDVPPEAASRPVESLPGRPDREQMLREAFELLGDGEPDAALRALQTAVAEADEAELEELERSAQERVGTPLGALLARTRVYVASRAEGGRAFRLEAATAYERAALGRVLDEQIRILLARPHQERTVEEWAAQRAEYKELQPDARTLVANASRAAALLKARLRFDPALKERRAEVARLTQLQRDLVNLAGRVRSMDGFTELDPDDRWIDPTPLPPGMPAARRSSP